jgi:hypothetical protein
LTHTPNFKMAPTKIAKKVVKTAEKKGSKKVMKKAAASKKVVKKAGAKKVSKKAKKVSKVGRRFQVLKGTRVRGRRNKEKCGETSDL